MANNTKDPVELHRAVVEGFATMTVEQARTLISDDLVLHEAEGLPFGGTYRGPEGFVELMQRIRADYPSFRFELDCLVGDGVENVLFQGRMSADTPNGHLTMPVMERWRFENDKAVEIIVCWHDTKRAAAMFGTAKA